VVGIVFGTTFGFPTNAYADCVNYIQSQTIAAAYEGDQVPTVHTMDTCGGDDVSYQIPIATTITFDGVQYSNIYATTNSVITFGNPDNTFHTYPSTPSISLYSMDWVSGWYNAQDTLNIAYSEGGFQIDLEVIPFGQWNTPTPSNINIIVAITNTGGISVAYSYQGPEYNNLRTGVRLHSGEVISLEAWGATQIQPGNVIPTLQAEPVSEPIVNPSPTPTPTPITPEEQQAAVVEAVTLANDIANLNNLIASINGDEVEEPEVIPDPEPTSEPTEEPDLPEPDVEVEPEIITPEDPRFPDEEEQTEPEDPNPSPSSDTTDEETVDPSPEPETSEEPQPEPSPQPTDTDSEPTPEPEPTDDQEPVSPTPNNDNTNSGNAISEEELNKLNKLIKVNDAKLMAAVSDFLIELSPDAKKSFASDLGIKTEEVAIIAEVAKENAAVAEAVVQFAELAANNEDAPMPYTLADAVTEIQADKFLENPIAALTDIDFDKIFSPSEWGADMTDDQREKVQEVIIPVIIVSNIVSSVMSLRRL
jgi:hypothetical protein